MDFRDPGSTLLPEPAILGGGPSRFPGLFGPLSSVPEIVTWSLPESFSDPWQKWLEAALVQSQDNLGDRWTVAFSNAPIWRFALAPGLVGPRPVTGLLMPSADSKGRYFPITFAYLLGLGVPLTRAVTEGVSWFHALENLALSTLEDGFDATRLAKRLTRLGIPFADADSDHASSKTAPDWYGRSRRFAADLSGEWRLPSEEDLHKMTGRFVAGRSLWWSSGTESIDPSFLVCDGMPEAAAFSALLNGDWKAAGWTGDIGED
jgi:type VI secretion system protein ImpM